jgi:hypothetical protein
VSEMVFTLNYQNLVFIPSVLSGVFTAARVRLHDDIPPLVMIVLFIQSMYSDTDVKMSYTPSYKWVNR